MLRDELLNTLIQELLAENPARLRASLPPQLVTEQRSLLRALMNIRPALPIRPELLEIQDRLLSAERETKSISYPDRLPTVREQFGITGIPAAERLVLWKGDITTLAADAIVNTANAKLLGCFIPLHGCIDNAIHSAAGIQLRLDCDEIMQRQGFDEPTGQAKITRGYNLPARYVLHTVGPIIHSAVQETDRRLLSSCYTACLEAAAEHEDIHSVAFCCISTGEFHFPKVLAAQIAVQTVTNWLAGANKQIERVIFNIFTQEDLKIYADLFRKN